jgi:UDP-N-acetylglucosamine:LPS N-acetylglucosamine transferase
MEKETDNILFLYLHTGGGHISAAKALSNRIMSLYPEEVTTHLLDPVPSYHLFIKHLFIRGYGFASHRYSSLWIGLYELTKLYPIKKLWVFLSTLTFKNRIKKELINKNITKVVVLHFLLVRAAYYASKESDPRIPVHTIVLDPFSAHPIWFASPMVPVIVLSEKVKRECLARYGYPKEKVNRFSIPLRTEFNQPLTGKAAAKAKKKHGFRADIPIILFAGGGEGFPNGYEYVRAFLHAKTKVQIAIVCGRDSVLKWHINFLAKRHSDSSVKAFGYIDFMFELMNIADLIVCKGGPATVMEVLILGKPPIISQYVYGQEKGNVEFVVHNKLGAYIEDPKEMVEEVCHLLYHHDAYHQLQENIRSLSIKNGTDDICRFLKGEITK